MLHLEGASGITAAHDGLLKHRLRSVSTTLGLTEVNRNETELLERVH